MASMEVPKLVFLFSLFLLQSISALENITLSSSLFANDNSSPWLSPSGDFAFGFHKPNNTNLFLLAIWFPKIPDKTIVWSANGDNPAQQGSKLQITTNGLLLTDPSDQQIWNGGIKTTADFSHGAMLDTGNFVLVGTNSDYLWESFKNPTDTILPSQTLESSTVLFSRLSETNFSRGRFELYFYNGDLRLSSLAWPTKFRYDPYFSSGTSPSGSQLVFNESSDINLILTDGTIAQLRWQSQNVSPSVARHYYRATIDYDGVFTQYAYPRGSNDEQNWSIVQYIPENICSAIVDGASSFGSGACGYNSYCIMSNGRPICTCANGYSLVDQNNPFGNCQPKFPLGCGVDDASENLEELYELRELKNVNWFYSDYERLQPYSEEECRTSCLQDCMCDVAIYNGNSDCWKKSTPLGHGMLMDINGDGSLKALIKVRKDAIPPLGSGSNPRSKKEKAVLLGALLGGSVFFNVTLLIVTCLILFIKKRERKLEKEVKDLSFFEMNLRFCAYKELEEATDDFKEELGRGAFGIVYKGFLKSGSGNIIAVKKLEKLAQEREREFRTEVSAIGKTHHKNLVRLLGYCDEGRHRLLIYEFMSNGTLANFLFSPPRPDWNQRIKIALGIARGLLYLHEECENPIIHCDIKPQNILLDDNFTAKISDFGLAKLLLSNQTRTKTMIRGTRGYVAPEWFKNVPITAKVDVYSFGVMLLEIICCRRSVVMEAEEEEMAILTDWAYDCYVGGRLDLLVENDEVAMDDADKLHKWVMIAIWCIQEDPSNRPTMKMVMEMLEGYLEVPSVPSPSSFSMH